MEQKQMDRDLKTRHISMIAIGGSIGTGLFMASGAIVSQAGPGGALIAYMLIGIMIYFLMTSLGELATFYPVSRFFQCICAAVYRSSCRLHCRLDVLDHLVTGSKYRYHHSSESPVILGYIQWRQLTRLVFCLFSPVIPAERLLR